MTETQRLPRKLSALLRIAVEDAQACENDSDYELDMGYWHGPLESGGCHVCLAGAVMARRLGVDPERTAHPSELWEEEALLAIDEMRCGYFLNAAGYIDADVTQAQIPKLARLQVELKKVYSRESGHAEWAEYLRCADQLEEIGL